jgi:signal transduction histidine kinase/CheY-like chemotaxis protein
VIHFDTEFAFVADTLVGIISVSAVLGVTLFVQLRMYTRQQKELQEAYRNLEEQTRLAESVSRAKSEFLAQMSHEIRTPMNAIIGMSHLALREEMRPQTREYVENIWRAGDNLVSIINDILDFSRIESGKLNIIPGEYQFASLINDSLSIIRTRLHEKPVRMFTMIDSTLPRQLVGDEARIRQILLNLLSNAVKYTREGHILLSIRGEYAESEYTAGERAGGARADNREIVLNFEVADTGIGITQEDIEKLFGNFVRVDGRKNQGIEGTGLGLAICQRLCLLMGGDITVRSVYGKGSTFTASLPQEIADDRPFAQVEAPEDKPVLLYENHRISAESLEYTLKTLGVSCSLADSRETLTELLEKGNYRFVFMPSARYSEFQDIQKNLQIRSGEPGCLRSSGITPVLFAEYGESIRADIKTLMTPIHPSAVAGILNGKASGAGYNHVQKSRGRFTAPDARILVVDDMVTNLEVITGLLSPYRVKIDRALEGLEAVYLIRKNHYDMVFMDHMMPGMDGIEATETIRKNEGDYFKNLPVIALTANAISGMREMFLEKGFNDYLSKPINIASLDVLLGKWIPGEKKIKEESWEKPETGEPGYGGIEDSGETGTPPVFALEGLDRARGVTNTGGTEAGYRKVLVQFCKDARERLPLLKNIPDEPGLPVFTSQVHALKSAAATIGATAVAAEAARLEAAGTAADMAAIAEVLPVFTERLAALAEGISAAMEAERAPEGDQRTSGASELRPLLRDLAEALEIKKARDIDRVLEELNQKPLDGKTREILDAVSDEVLVAEYDKALKTITALLED